MPGNVDPDAAALAAAFLAVAGETARLAHTRTQLEHLYGWSWDSWVPRDNQNEPEYDQDDWATASSFSKVLFAMAHTERALHVRHNREIVWRRA